MQNQLRFFQSRIIIEMYTVSSCIYPFLSKWSKAEHPYLKSWLTFVLFFIFIFTEPLGIKDGTKINCIATVMANNKVI